MANNKIDRINKEIAKTREKITEYQNKLKGLEAQKTEAENLEIVQLVRAMRVQTKTRELYSPVLSLLASSMPLAVADMIFKSVSLIVSSMVSS